VLATLVAARAFAQAGSDLDEAALDPVQAERLGFNYWLGRGVERDYVEAARLLEQAAAAHRPYAAAALAGLYQRGEGVPLDLARARELNQTAAELGVAAAQWALAYDVAASVDDPAARNLAAAIPWLNAAAEQEEPAALFLLGQMYRFDDAVGRNRDLGLKLMTRAAELGYEPASTEAAGFLLAEDAAADDVQRALYFLNKAASSGFPPSQYALGKLYLEGRHVAPDAAVAAQWLTRAHEREYPPATLWLAELYAKGLGVDADADRAAELRARVLPTLTVAARNELAWELAVSPAAELRSGELAVEIIEGVAAEYPVPAYIDTLAAAYAEAGRFEDAVRAQQRAIDALPSDVPAASLESFRERLELYRSGQPYRETP
jgi:TPR repeat protein